MTRKREKDPTEPYDLDAERCVLGAITVHDAAYDTAVGILSPAMFYRHAHRLLFEGMCRLREERVRIDSLTLKDAMARTGALEEVGGASYIAALADGMPSATNVKYYAEIVAEKARLRRIIEVGTTTIAAAYEADSSASEILRRADLAFLDIQATRGSQMQAMKTRIGPLMASLEYRMAHKGELRGLPTGFAKMDELTFGWRRGELIFAAARPSIGKTTFLLNTLTAAARAGYKAALFSFEMKRQELDDKLLSSISGIPLTRIEGGFFGEPDWPVIANALTELEALPLSIDDTVGLTIHDVNAICRRMKNEDGLDIVGIDYAQLFPGSLDRRNATRNDELTEVSRTAKIMAGELDVPVIMLSQLKRLETIKGGSVKPKLEDLRDCGAFEQDANTVILGHRKTHREGGPTEWTLEKQRSGPTGTVILEFDRDCALFRDAVDEAASA